MGINVSSRKWGWLGKIAGVSTSDIRGMKLIPNTLHETWLISRVSLQIMSINDSYDDRNVCVSLGVLDIINISNVCFNRF